MPALCLILWHAYYAGIIGAGLLLSESHNHPPCNARELENYYWFNSFQSRLRRRRDLRDSNNGANVSKCMHTSLRV